MPLMNLVTVPLVLNALGGYAYMSQGFGEVPSHQDNLYYSNDYVVPLNTPVISIGSGTVIDIRSTVKDGKAASNGDASEGPSRIGNFVTVYYPDRTLYVTYAHLGQGKVNVAKGATVYNGQVLGYVGNTGFRTGTHLHVQYGVRKIQFTDGGSRDSSRWSIVADGSAANGVPIRYQTAIGFIMPGIVSEKSFDFATDRRSLPPSGSHHITLLGTNNLDAYGDAEGNTISGNDGRNYLQGGLGSDALYGGGGSDRLRGGEGRDSLTGGALGDMFEYTGFGDSLPSARDTILDFNYGEGDRIDLVGIDADPKTTRDDAFTFLGASSFSGKAGQLRFQSGILEADLNGDRKADFQIQLSGVSSLQAAAIKL